MNKSKFISMFEAIRDDLLGTERNSKTDSDDAYDTFLDLTEQLSDIDNGDTAFIMMERMSGMDDKEMLHWRMCLAESGIEMTPSQVEEYIILLDLALSYTIEGNLDNE